MIESKGKLIWCPFRTRKHYKDITQWDVDIETTHFMPCMKEECICYNKYENDDVVTECCYRDNISYCRSWNKVAGEQEYVDELLKQLEAVEKEYPYKVVGQPETYSQYNEAWQDCIDRVIGIVKGGAE